MVLHLSQHGVGPESPWENLKSSMDSGSKDPAMLQ